MRLGKDKYKKVLKERERHCLSVLEDGNSFKTPLMTAEWGR